MDRLKKHEDELDFFALELQSRRVMLGPWGGVGRSFFMGFFQATAVATSGRSPHFLWSRLLAPWPSGISTRAGEALGLSAANTLNVFGFRREFGMAIDTPFAWLEVMSALQTIFGTILLFLFGLGVRNKFRMK
jgi:uroporphyrinogen-III synthase